MIEHPKYKIRSKRLPIKRKTPTAATEAEQLSGMVNGFGASDLEERFARALNKKRIPFYFRFALGERGMPGWKELDFLVIHFGYRPVQIDDISFVHRGTESEDKLRDAITMQMLRDYNPQPVAHVTNQRLYSQDAADAVVREMFL